MNKRKRVAMLKHRRKRKKMEEKRKLLRLAQEGQLQAVGVAPPPPKAELAAPEAKPEPKAARPRQARPRRRQPKAPASEGETT
jgi:hypothetical protein